jgi:hypothetical protein
MNKAVVVNPNSRTKTGAHCQLESDNRQLSNKTSVLKHHRQAWRYAVSPLLRQRPHRFGRNFGRVHYSLLIVNSAACGGLPKTVRSVTIIDIMLFFIFFSLCLNAFSEDMWASAEVNVRTGPGPNYDIMGQLYKNEKIEIFDIVNGWAQILFEETEGYVRADLLFAERILTPEEEEAARIAAEQKRIRLEQEQKKAQFLHIVKIIVFVIVGILGFIIIIFIP